MKLEEINVYYYHSQQLFVMYIKGLKLKYYSIKDVWYYQIIDNDEIVYLPKITNLTDEEKFQNSIYWEYKIDFHIVEQIQNIINDKYVFFMVMKTLEKNNTLAMDTIIINEN